MLLQQLIQPPLLLSLSSLLLQLLQHLSHGCLNILPS
jgi:hypothetical protein